MSPFGAQGGILVGGFSWRQHPDSGENGYEFGITRLSGAGQLDVSFGVNGVAVADFGGIVGVRNENFIQAMTLDENGRIVVAGYARKYDTTTGQYVENSRHALARFHSDGSMDPSFGTNGTVLTDFGPSHYYAYTVAIDSEGRILAGGNTHLARYLADGTLDDTFGTAGTGKVATTGSFRAIVVDANDRILLGGSNNILRYTTSGAPDTDIAPSGRLVVANSSIHALMLDSSDRILIAGNTWSTGPTGADFMVARYLTTGLAVTVQNVAPQNLAITGPSTALEGSTIQLTGSATDPGVHDQLSYSWTITRNGAAYSEAAGQAITFAAYDNGAYVATMRVDDGDGGVSTESHAIDVTNAAPDATPSSNETIVYGESITISLTDPVDPSPVDTSAGFRYSFGLTASDLANMYLDADGASSWSPELAAGTHMIHGRIFDKDNGYNEYTTTVVVQKAELTVTADNQSKVYGEADPALTYTPSGELFYDDEYDVISGVVLSTATGADATAGTHAITAAGGTADNYAITHVDGTLTVEQAALTVTADNQSKVYGEADPALTYTPSGELFYDDEYDVISGVVLATATGADATAGTHAITAAGGTADNYAITHVDGTLSVAKAELNLAVQDAEKVYGEENPQFAVVYSGFVYSDDVSVLVGDIVFSTPAEMFSDVGTYIISASGLQAANYALQYIDATLAITQAEQSIHWGNLDAILQGVPLSEDQLNATVAGVSGGSAPGELSYDPDFGTVLDAGFHTLTVTAAETQNYMEATASVALTVSGVSLLDDGTLLIVGTDDADRVHLNGQGRHGLKVHTDFYLDGKHKTFSTADVDRIVIELLGGDDHLTTAGNVHIPLLARAGSGNDRVHLAGGPAVVVGGTGNDDIKGGAGRSVLIGGLGSNTLKAGRSGDVLVAGGTELDDDDEALFDLLESWNSNESFADRMNDVIATLANKVIDDDAAVNTLHGGAGHDLFFADLEDNLKGNKRRYTVVNG